MRDKIENIIISLGFDIDSFIIGNGARSDYSEIHFELNRNKQNIDHKEYAVQFYNEKVAIWEIGKRIEKFASLTLHFNDARWNDINELRIIHIRIKNDSEKTVAAAMPLNLFELFLRGNFCEQNEEQIYMKCVEGNRYSVYTTRYERDPRLRRQAITVHGTRCQICGFSFAEKYGEIGEGFIEVHHKRPISDGVQEVNPKTDLACLCSNCHRMIHRNNGVMTIEELREIITKYSMNERET